MQTIGGVLRSEEYEIHLGWRHIQSWVERVLITGRTAEIVLFSFALTLYAVVLFCLYDVVQNSTIVDSSPMWRYKPMEPLTNQPHPSTTIRQQSCIEKRTLNQYVALFDYIFVAALTNLQQTPLNHHL